MYFQTNFWRGRSIHFEKKNEMMCLTKKLGIFKTIKNLSEKQLFASCHVPPYAFCYPSTYSNILYKIIKKFILKLFSMFVFYMFSQYPVDENKLFCIKTVIKTITFSLKKPYIVLILWIDVSHNTMAI